MAYARNTPAWHDFPATDTAIDSVDLEGWEHGLLGTNADMVVLYWNGTTYVPRNGDTTVIRDTSKGRLFVGPVDPATVTGATVVDLDRWDQYT